MSGILKARLGHWYRARASNGLLLSEFNAESNNMKLAITSCNDGVTTGPLLPFMLPCSNVCPSFAVREIPEPLQYAVGSRNLGALFEVTSGSPVGAGLPKVRMCPLVTHHPDTTPFPQLKSNDVEFQLNASLASLALGINTTYSLIRMVGRCLCATLSRCVSNLHCVWVLNFVEQVSVM